MDNNISFSVIIPTYNRASFLDSLLFNLKKQTYENFEVVICDDGSTDDTEIVVSRHKLLLDINYIKLNNSGGPALPRNIGIENSKYEWLCFLDSDDDWTNDKLEVLSYYITQSNNDIYYHKVLQVDINNNFHKKIGNYRKGLLKNDFESLLYNGSQVVNSSLCVKKSIITNQFLYDTNPEFKAIEDYIFILKLTNSGYKIKHINKVLGYYRIHDENISANKVFELDKLKLFYSTKPFTDINIFKLNALFCYISLNHYPGSKISKVNSYFSIIIKPSTIELKIKSFFKIIQIFFNTN